MAVPATRVSTALDFSSPEFWEPAVKGENISGVGPAARLIRQALGIRHTGPLGQQRQRLFVRQQVREAATLEDIDHRGIAAGDQFSRCLRPNLRSRP